MDYLPRAYPTRLKAVIDLDSWRLPESFQWLQDHGSLTNQDMLRTFNCGIGMVLFINPSHEKRLMKVLNSMGADAFKIGFVEKRLQKQPAIVFNHQLS